MVKGQRNHEEDHVDPFVHAYDEPAGLTSANGWESPSVTFRLTEERRRALFALTPELGLRASPTAAIDFAIERAARMGAASLARDADTDEDDAHDAILDELRAVHDVCAGLRAENEETRTSLARVESCLADLVGAEREGDPERSFIEESAKSPPSLSAWLDRVAGPSVTWALVKARWLDARPAGAGKAKLRVDAWAAAPLEFARHTASLETVEAGPMRMLALAAFERDSIGIIVCSRTPRGWTAKVHALDAQGKLGPELDSFDA